MYIMQMHVNEYVIYVRSGNIVTRNTIDYYGLQKAEVVDTWDASHIIEIFELKDEGPDTVQMKDWM